MAESTRTFVGIPLPAAFRQKLERLTQNLSKIATKARWTHPLDYHLTLAFLGSIPHSDLREICSAVAQASSTFPTFEIGLQGIGAFPDLTKPRVIWAGVTGDLGALGSLQERVVKAIESVGYRPEDNRFHPHITLGRLKPGRAQPAIDLSNTEAHLRTWTAGPWTVDSVITYASHREAEGASYTPLGTVKLQRASTRTSPE